MSDRIDLPSNRRPQALFDFDVSAKARFTAALGWADKPSMRRGDDPVEVFLSCSRTTDIEALGRDVAILVSLLRQHGCGFDTMRAAVTRVLDPTKTYGPDERGEPASLAGRLLDEIETFTREEATELALQGGGL